MPPSTQLLNKLRQYAEAELSGLCEIHRYTAVQNDLGESVRTWAVQATGVPCKLVSAASVTARERIRLEAIGQVTNWLIAFAHTQDITSKDKVYITDPLPMRTFQVMQITGPHAEEIRRLAWVDEVS